MRLQPLEYYMHHNLHFHKFCTTMHCIMTMLSEDGDGDLQFPSGIPSGVCSSKFLPLTIPGCSNWFGFSSSLEIMFQNAFCSDGEASIHVEQMKISILYDTVLVDHKDIEDKIWCS